MGFDFFMVEKPQAAVGYRPEMRDRPEWYRLNWRGMDAVFQGMRIARVLESKTPKPDLSPAGGTTSEEKESLLSTRSSVGGAVPYWKFATNEGWLVSPAECEVIASGIERCLETKPVTLRLEDSPSDAPLDGYHRLLREWVAFNRFASTHGGYRVL